MGVTHKAKPVVAVWAARGGHGATVVAGALGALLDAPVRSHDPDAMAWAWSATEEESRRCDIIVRDSGVVRNRLPESQTNVVVLRGPCSLAIRALARTAGPIDHVVLLREPWRPLRPKDVEDALGNSIAAEVPFSPRVARLLDAGLLHVTIHALDEFTDLKAWAELALAGMPRVVPCYSPVSDP